MALKPSTMAIDDEVLINNAIIRVTTLSAMLQQELTKDGHSNEILHHDDRPSCRREVLQDWIVGFADVTCTTQESSTDGVGGGARIGR